MKGRIVWIDRDCRCILLGANLLPQVRHGGRLWPIYKCWLHTERRAQTGEHDEVAASDDIGQRAFGLRLRWIFVGQRGRIYGTWDSWLRWGNSQPLPINLRTQNLHDTSSQLDV